MDRIFDEILSMSIDSVWLIIAVIVVRAFLQKSPKYFRKLLWGMVGFRLLFPFSFESAFSLVPAEVPRTAEVVVDQVTATNIEQGLSLAGIVPFLWMGIGSAFLIYGIITYIKLKIRIFDGVLLKNNIYQSEKIESPFVCGFIKPKIYLPYGLDEVTSNCVLKHEQTHIRYGDHIIKAIGFVVLCIHWFNPLVWVSYFLLCKDIELSCDESVIKKYNDAECKEYAKALLDLGVNKVKLSACPVAFGEVSIKTRIKSVINYKKANKFLVLASLCLCAIVPFFFMTEPEVPLKEGSEKVEIPEETTEPVKEEDVEITTETVTEPTTKAVTEPETEVVEEVYETVKATEEDYEEMISVFESMEAEKLEEMRRQNELIMEEANKGNGYNLYNGSSISNSSNNSTQTPTSPVIIWDPAVTQAPAQNYGNTNHPHFEGNRWVY